MIFIVLSRLGTPPDNNIQLCLRKKFIYTYINITVATTDYIIGTTNITNGVGLMNSILSEVPNYRAEKLWDNQMDEPTSIGSSGSGQRSLAQSSKPPPRRTSANPFWVHFFFYCWSTDRKTRVAGFLQFLCVCVFSFVIWWCYFSLRKYHSVESTSPLRVVSATMIYQKGGCSWDSSLRKAAATIIHGRVLICPALKLLL